MRVRKQGRLCIVICQNGSPQYLHLSENKRQVQCKNLIPSKLDIVRSFATVFNQSSNLSNDFLLVIFGQFTEEY